MLDTTCHPPLDKIYFIWLSMAWCKITVTPVRYQWSYCSLALSHWYSIHDINSMASWRCGCNFRSVIFNLILGMISWALAAKLISFECHRNPTGDGSALVQVMAWCSKAINHYLYQCLPRSMSPYGIVRSQWVKILSHEWNSCQFADNIFKCIFL